MTGTPTTPDVIVIGAGIAGMAVSIALQHEGYQVLTIERRDRAGGLCGTAVMNGYEFTIGCNEFGSAFETAMIDLGVDITFAHPKTTIYTDKEKYVSPPTAATVGNVLRHLPDILRVAGALRAGKTRNQYPYLSQVISRVRSRDLADLLSLVSFGFGAAPKDFPTETLMDLFSKELAYGYGKTVTPIGGPGLLAARMAARLTDLGGTQLLNTAVTYVDTNGPVKKVTTENGVYQARHIVSSQSRLDLYPPEAKPSLAIGALHLAVPARAPFPSGMHTVVDLPANAPRWLDCLDAGELPEEFGFNIFPCDFLDSRDYRSFTAFLLLPRGLDDPDPHQVEHIENYLMKCLDARLPGLTENLLYKLFVSPRAYRELHGLSSEVVPALTPAGFRKPEGYDSERDIYYVGNSVQPPCEHACSALLSGLRTATAIQQHDTRREIRRDNLG